ncbi:hypothetical protein EDB85DRAFT_410047 [Lactarius pseudohatsudake]|nr:hypothetical protein EDB85DRAFT_410047 [Lactarius pseudohatsudake]
METDGTHRSCRTRTRLHMDSFASSLLSLLLGSAVPNLDIFNIFNILIPISISLHRRMATFVFVLHFRRVRGRSSKVPFPTYPGPPSPSPSPPSPNICPPSCLERRANIISGLDMACTDSLFHLPSRACPRSSPRCSLAYQHRSSLPARDPPSKRTTLASARSTHRHFLLPGRVYARTWTWTAPSASRCLPHNIRATQPIALPTVGTPEPSDPALIRLGARRGCPSLPRLEALQRCCPTRVLPCARAAGRRHSCCAPSPARPVLRTRAGTGAPLYRAVVADAAGLRRGAGHAHAPRAAPLRRRTPCSA